MKKKLLLTSVLSIILCFSLICGATFALFTSESKVNIAVTSGKVEVVANVSKYEYSYDSSLAGANTDIVITDNEDGTYSVSKMLPGDAINFDVAIENNSNVAVKYQIAVAVDGDLAEVLEVVIKQGETTLMHNSTTSWQTLGAGADIDDVTVTVAFPVEVTTHMSADANIAITVNAIQGNAATGPVAILNEFAKENLPKEENNELWVLDDSSLGGIPFPDIPDDVVIETAYNFQTTETAEEANVSKYGNWLCDFVIECDQDVDIGELGLTGQFGGWTEGNESGNDSSQWLTFGIPMALEAGQKLPMLTSVGLPQTYYDICNSVKSFNCGLFRGAGDNAMKGKTVTVSLCLADVDTAMQKTGKTDASQLTIDDFSEADGTLIIVNTTSYYFA